MKNEISIKDLNLVYWLFICLFTVELAQIASKYFNEYYFNRVALGVFNLLLIYFGINLGINKVFVIGYGILSMALVVASLVVVWN